MTTGFLDAYRGKIITPASALQRFGKGGAASAGGGNINTQIGAQGNGADTTEDTLFSFTLPANSLDAVGRNLIVTAQGTFNSTVANKTLRLYFGSSIVLSSGAQSSVSVGWWLQYNLFKSGSSTQVCNGQFIIGTVHGGCVDLPGTEADGSSVLIKVTGQSSVATANVILCKAFSVIGLN